MAAADTALTEMLNIVQGHFIFTLTSVVDLTYLVHLSAE